MFEIVTRAAVHLLQSYGYLAVFVLVGLESAGIPLPGETMLVVASVYAGATHQLAIGWVIAVAAGAAILGDNLGYWVGREGGFRLLRRYGHFVRLDERKLKLAVYLFDRHGPKVVFLGRFVTVLRAWAAIVAGSVRMRWAPFLVFNAAGGILWATIYGLAGYIFGNSIEQLAGTIGKATVALAVIAIVVFLILIGRHQRRWEEEAERALPGPLEDALAARGTFSPPPASSK
jgi:membrane protein DedA with SNARE-associated domain